MRPDLAVDCGGTRLRVATGRGVELMDRLPDLATPPDLDDLAGAIAAMAAGRTVGAVGIGVAGLVADGRVLWMPHRSGGPAPLAEAVAAALRVPVVVDNDANMAGLAEARHGAGAGRRTVLMVTMGTGIGGALVIDGRVERGRGHLGEIGHLPIDPAGTPCACGLSGCWEAVASGRAIDAAARRLVAADPRGDFAGMVGDAEATGAALVAAAGAGSAAASAALAEVGAAFGRGLAALVAVFDPDVIVVGGVGAAIGDRFLDPARGAMMAATPGAAVRRTTPVVAARFGEDAGLIGAALAAEEVTS